MSNLKDAETKLINDGNEEAAQALETFEFRWRYAVFPAMIAFTILSAFGFYLIFGMLQHMQSMSNDINRMTSLMETSVPVISSDISQLNNTIAISMPGIQSDVGQMSQSAQSMATSTQQMNRSTWEMNRSISRPLNMFNNMVPFNVHPPTPVRYSSF
jgi:predicted PurR-regulated permease PerM